VLSAANTYAGATIISGGTLLVSGSISSSAVTVNSGGTLAGSGAVGSISQLSGGIVMPGTNSTTTGILSSGAVTLHSGGSFNVAINGTTAGTGYDQLVASGKVNLASANLNVTLGFTPAVGNAFTLIKNNSGTAIIGTFNGLAEGASIVINGMTFKISYLGGAGHDVVITRTA
jgi:uncharacterized protein with beta-barrel porin domain